LCHRLGASNEVACGGAWPGTRANVWLGTRRVRVRGMQHLATPRKTPQHPATPQPPLTTSHVHIHDGLRLGPRMSRAHARHLTVRSASQHLATPHKTPRDSSPRTRPGAHRMLTSAGGRSATDTRWRWSLGITRQSRYHWSAFLACGESSVHTITRLGGGACTAGGDASAPSTVSLDCRTTMTGHCRRQEGVGRRGGFGEGEHQGGMGRTRTGNGVDALWLQDPHGGTSQVWMCLVWMSGVDVSGVDVPGGGDHPCHNGAVEPSRQATKGKC